MLRGRIVATLALFLTGCASLPDNDAREESRALQDTATTTLGRQSEAARLAHPGPSGFRPLKSGVDALLARIILAEAAQRSLDVQYYIWHDDLTGRIFANALLRAADRGVRVRVLLDDVGAQANDAVLLSLDSHPNIEIRLFNPVASRSFRGLSMLSDFSRVNRRMHNKAYVADNQMAILGGRNIGDEYFEASSEVAFGDLDVLTVGPVVAEVSTAFDQFWNAPSSYPITTLLGRDNDSDTLSALRAELAAYIETNRDSPYVTRAGSRLAEEAASGRYAYYWGKATLLYDDPVQDQPGTRCHRRTPAAPVQRRRRTAASGTADRLALFRPGRGGRGLAAGAGESRDSRHGADQLPCRNRCRRGALGLSALPASAARGRRRSL